LQGFGIAPTTAGNNWTAYGWNGSSQVVGGANLTVATDGSETNLLVGKVEFDAGGGGEDIYTLYQYQLNAGSIAGGTLNEITSILVDVNQSTLDTLSLTRQVNTAYDEIRIGTTLNDVIPVPEPGSLALLGLGGLLMLRRSSAQVARRRRS
jgi:MYXO-CTERM domain-containing protein